MTRVIYQRKGNHIDPNPILIEEIGVHEEFDPQPFFELIADKILTDVKSGKLILDEQDLIPSQA